MIKKCVAYSGAFFDCSHRIIIFIVCKDMTFNSVELAI
jgi:hypothetical protein